MLYVASFINQSLSIYFESYVVKCQAHMIYFVDEMSVDFFSCQNVNTPPQKRAFISFMFKTTCQKDNFIVNISVYGLQTTNCETVFRKKMCLHLPNGTTEKVKTWF